MGLVFCKTLFSRCTFLLSLLAVTFLVSSQALAFSLNKKDAEEVKSIVSDAVDYYVSTFPLERLGLELKKEGQMKVETANDYYAVTTPYYSIKNKDDESLLLDIGIFAINAVPSDQDGVWNMSLALPSPIKLMETHGYGSGMTLNLGKQAILITWDSTHKVITSSNISIDNSVITFDEDSNLSIGKIAAAGQLTKGNDGWFGPFNFHAKDIVMNMFGQNIISVDDIVSESKVSGFSVASYNKYMEKNRELMNQMWDVMGEYEDGEQDSGFMDPSPEDGNAFGSEQNAKFAGEKFQILNVKGSEIMLEYLQDAYDHFAGNITIKGMNIKTANMMIGEIELGFKNNNMRSDSASIGFNISFSEPHFIPPPLPEYFMPKQFNIDVQLYSVPVSGLVSWLKDGIGKHIADLESGNIDASYTPDMSELSKFFYNAGTGLRILDSVLDTGSLKVVSNADFVSSSTAAYGAYGNANILISGLDHTIEKLRQAQSIQEEAGRVSPLINQSLQMLTMAKLVGKAKPESDKSVDVSSEDTKDSNESVIKQNDYLYEFEVSPEGIMLMNDSNIQDMMGGISNTGRKQ